MSAAISALPQPRVGLIQGSLDRCDGLLGGPLGLAKAKITVREEILAKCCQNDVNISSLIPEASAHGHPHPAQRS